MAQWLETPAIVVAVLAVLALLWKAAHWKGTVDEYRKTMDEHRGTVASFMKEIRDKIDRIFERLPPVPVKRGSPLRLTDFGAQITSHQPDGGADAYPRGFGGCSGRTPTEAMRYPWRRSHGKRRDRRSNGAHSAPVRPASGRSHA